MKNLKNIFEVLNSIFNLLRDIKNYLALLDAGQDDILKECKKARISTELMLENQNEAVNLLTPSENQLKDKTECEQPHFEITDDTSAEDVMAAYKDERIAIYCADENEWKESVNVVSFYGITDNERKAPNTEKCIIDGYGRLINKKENNTHCVQTITLFDSFEHFISMTLQGYKTADNFVQGNLQSMADNGYIIVNWSDIRNLFNLTTTTETDEASENISNAGEILRSIRDKKMEELKAGTFAVEEEISSEFEGEPDA